MMLATKLDGVLKASSASSSTTRDPTFSRQQRQKQNYSQACREVVYSRIHGTALLLITLVQYKLSSGYIVIRFPGPDLEYSPE
jgi:hypothetical protein